MATENPVTRRIRRALFNARNLGLLTIGGGFAGLAASPAPDSLFAAAAFFGGAWFVSVLRDMTAPGREPGGLSGAGDRTRAGGFNERERRRTLRELEIQLEEITKAARARGLHLSPDFLQRRHQLLRIIELERQIATQRPDTAGTIDPLPADIHDEVSQFVDRAIELSKLRAAMLRAFVRTNETVLQQELDKIRGRHERTTGPAKADLELLVQAKEEQLEAFRRLRNDLVSTEAQLDAIEAFLHTVTYSQSLTVGSVRQQMIRLKTKIEARRQSVEEVQRIVTGLER